MSDFAGKTIGGFQLVETLDEGGDRLVFKSFQPSMNRYVAVKILKPSAVRDPNAVQVFLQQGELMARMRYPNILEVYTSGQMEGIVYRAERFAEGGSLRDQLNWFYDPQQTLALAEQIVSAVEYIHEQGFVHGNLKPSSILLDARKSPLLVDFGTPPLKTRLPSPYLAPEQVRGGVVDARTDVYALGVLVFEVLVGQALPPGRVISLRAHRPELPEALERVILKAMAQHPDQRFRTVGEFLTAMQSALEEPSQVSPVYYQPAPFPPPAPTPTVSQSVNVTGHGSRTNWLAVVLTIILVSVLCIGGFFTFRYLTQDQKTDQGKQQPIQPSPGVTIIVPTVVLPTQEPLPTQPPVEPTQPPAEPTQPPPEPTQHPPEPTKLPDESPIETPSGENAPILPEKPPAGPVGQLPDFLPESCRSVAFISIGIGLVSAARIKKRTYKH